MTTRLVLDPIRRDTKGRLVVTDWQGKAHTFNDHAKGLDYAADLYRRKPRSIQAAKHERMSRWTNPPRSIVWHYERHSFTEGRAVLSHK